MKITTFIEAIDDKGTPGDKLCDLRQELLECCLGRKRIQILFPCVIGAPRCSEITCTIHARKEKKGSSQSLETIARF